MGYSDNNIEDLVVGQSNWKDRAHQRKLDKPWLKKSRAIAFKVLDALKSKKMTQVQLAELLEVSPQQVNKIVMGRENLTLDTISKLEDALGISLFVMPNELIETTPAASSELPEFKQVSKRELKVSEPTKVNILK
jgi:transcriptional regulator with XRE-family HTH domain